MVNQVINGKREGLWRCWYSNGQLYIEGYYFNDRRDGLWRCWFENGQLWEEGYYFNGKKDGLWRWWHDNGQLCENDCYVNGKQEGLYRRWHKNGQLSIEGHYIDGFKHGKWKEGGCLMLSEYKIRYYLWGVPVTKKEFEMPPEKVDIEKYILREKNAQRRMAWLKKVGMNFFFRKGKPKVLDKQGDYELLEFGVDKFKWRALKMRNPSMGVYHIEGVSDSVKTVDEALFFRKPEKMKKIPIDDVNGEDWYQQGDVYIWSQDAKSLKSKPTILT